MLNNDFQPLVSIIIPIYNGSNYMQHAINSALNQTYPKVEVIVVDDGSSDNTEEIALSYKDQIRYYKKKNGGCATALNFAIREMHGQYFSWLSHDDVYYPNKIEHQINTLKSINDSNAIIYGDYEVIDENSKLLAKVNISSFLPEDKRNNTLLPLLRGLIHGCSLLIPVKYFHTIGFFDETLISTHDYALWFDFIRVAPIYYDGETLIQSRSHSKQGVKNIPTHFEEASALWCRFVENLTIDEMNSMANSPYELLTQMAYWLRSANKVKAKAAQLAEERANAELQKIPILKRNSIIKQTIKNTTKSSRSPIKKQSDFKKNLQLLFYYLTNHGFNYTCKKIFFRLSKTK